MKKLLQIIIVVILIGCRSDKSSLKTEPELYELIQSKEDIEFRENAIGDHVKSYTILSESCEKYFTQLMLEVNIFPENMEIVEFLEVIPDSVIPSKFYNIENGVFIYTKLLSIEDGDSAWFTGTGFYDNSTQILATTKIIGKGIFEIDTMTQIYLPFRDSACSCGNLNLDSSLRVPFVPFGSWSRVDKNGQPIK